MIQGTLYYAVSHFETCNILQQVSQNVTEVRMGKMAQDRRAREVHTFWRSFALPFAVCRLPLLVCRLPFATKSEGVPNKRHRSFAAACLPLAVGLNQSAH